MAPRRSQASLRGGAWNAKARLQRVPIEMLTKLAQSFKLTLPAITATGSVTLTADARGAQGGLNQSTFDVSFAELTLNNESGSIATDKLSARLQGTARKSAGDWQFEVELTVGARPGVRAANLSRFRRARIACKRRGSIARLA